MQDWRFDGEETEGEEGGGEGGRRGREEGRRRGGEEGEEGGGRRGGEEEKRGGGESTSTNYMYIHSQNPIIYPSCSRSYAHISHTHTNIFWIMAFGNKAIHKTVIHDL